MLIYFLYSLYNHLVTFSKLTSLFVARKLSEQFTITKGRRKKWYLWVVGAVGGFEARPQLSAKKVPVFFLVPFDAETFKTCKYTQKFFYLGLPPPLPPKGY